MLSASSPATRFAASGTADAVLLKYSEIGVKPDAAIRKYLQIFQLWPSQW